MKKSKLMCWACVVSLFFTLCSIGLADPESKNPKEHVKKDEDQKGHQEKPNTITDKTAQMLGEVFFAARKEPAKAFKDWATKLDDEGGIDGKKVVEVLNLGLGRDEELTDDEAEAKADLFAKLVPKMNGHARNEVWMPKLKKLQADWDKKAPKDEQFEASANILKMVFDNSYKDLKGNDLKDNPPPKRDGDPKENTLKVYDKWSEKREAVMAKTKEMVEKEKIAGNSRDFTNADKKAAVENAGADIVREIQYSLKTGDKDTAHRLIKQIAGNTPAGLAVNMVGAEGKAITQTIPDWAKVGWEKTDKFFSSPKMAEWDFGGLPHDQSLKPQTFGWNKDMQPEPKQAVPQKSTGGAPGAVPGNNVQRSANATPAQGTESAAEDKTASTSHAPVGSCMQCHSGNSASPIEVASDGSLYKGGAKITPQAFEKALGNQAMRSLPKGVIDEMRSFLAGTI